jgi:NAD+ synthase (glutamine-hydrolysing)
VGGAGPGVRGSRFVGLSRSVAGFQFRVSSFEFRSMRIALAQINTTVGDFSGNLERIIQFAQRALDQGANIAVFPELALCGYPPRDLVERPDFVERSESELRRLAQMLPPIPAWVGSIRRSGAAKGKQVSDVAALLYRGRIETEYAKILLPFYDVFDESRYFEPGDGPVTYLMDDERLGITICEDVWNDKNFWKRQLYPRDPVEETVKAGAQVLLNIAASPYSTGRIPLRQAMLKAIAVEHRLPVVYVNVVGGNDSLIFDGSSCAFNARGELCARARSFEEDLVIFDTTSEARHLHPEPTSETEAVYQALVLGVKDYVRKCGFKTAIVGLSGGIDSSVVAVIATRALGPGNVFGVSMPGPYSSPGSVRDARELAANLGIHFRVIPITSIYESYTSSLAPAFGDRPPDVTEENIQARIRGNILMALSNKYCGLLLSTGNKSELAVGYCTLYGDMAGGLAVIADIPKTMVYELARYINCEGKGNGPIPQASLEKAPSAELRANQTDQDTLPPYDVLDTILRAYVEENLCAQDIIARFHLDPGVVHQTICRVTHAEYKRQQAAPALRVTAKAFGIGRRFPIANKFVG